MNLDRARAEAQTPRRLFAGFTRNNGIENIAFARTERSQPRFAISFLAFFR